MRLLNFARYPLYNRPLTHQGGLDPCTLGTQVHFLGQMLANYVRDVKHFLFFRLGEEILLLVSHVIDRCYELQTWLLHKQQLSSLLTCVREHSQAPADGLVICMHMTVHLAIFCPSYTRGATVGLKEMAIVRQQHVWVINHDNVLANRTDPLCPYIGCQKEFYYIIV